MFPTPLLIGDVLHFLGFPGTIVTVVVLLFAAYHIKEILDTFSRVGMWIRISGAALLLLALGAVFVPGFEIVVNVGSVIDFGGDLWRMVPWDTFWDLLKSHF